MSDRLLHPTREGDRWDLLAWDYYGDPCRLGPLLRANPDHAHLSVLPAGLTLVIPVLDEPEPAAAPGLPPWRA